MKNPLILRSLIFLNQQLTRLFYDHYQGVQGGVQPFQKSHIVFDQLFYRYFLVTIKTKFIIGIYI